MKISVQYQYCTYFKVIFNIDNESIHQNSFKLIYTGLQMFKGKLENFLQWHIFFNSFFSYG